MDNQPKLLLIEKSYNSPKIYSEYEELFESGKIIPFSSVISALQFCVGGLIK
jgi:hypothetical protein